LDLLEHVLGEVVDGLVVDVVPDGQCIKVRRAMTGKEVVYNVLGGLDEIRAVVKVILRVQVKVDDVVSKIR
jgi:hypothetical protein